MLVSSSSRILKEPKEPIPAITRFAGTSIRTLKKHAFKLKNVDVLLLSPRYGLISPKKKIPYHELIGNNWNRIDFVNNMDFEREKNIAQLQKVLSRKSYDEIYVNVGQEMMQLIKGFEDTIPKNIKIVFSRGKGIGPKTAHMKEWIEKQS